MKTLFLQLACYQDDFNTVRFTMNSCISTMNQHQGNTNTIDFTINSIACYKEIIHQSNTSTVDFTRTSIGFTMNWHQGNTNTNWLQ